MSTLDPVFNQDADHSEQHVLGSQVFDYWFDTSEFMV
jgi:hypothetical protein